VTTRYFLTIGNDAEREVTMSAYVNAERNAGFHNTCGRPDLPATSSFGGHLGGHEIHGVTRTEAQTQEPMKLYAVLDLRSRWFELYTTREAAQSCADRMNATLGAKCHVDRYVVSEATVNEETP